MNDVTFGNQRFGGRDGSAGFDWRSSARTRCDCVGEGTPCCRAIDRWRRRNRLRREIAARRYRGSARSRLEDLLARSRRFRHAADLRLRKSTNVKSVSMEWPAPMRFDDGAGGHSIGYHDHVIWPLRVTSNDASKPASLHVKLHYAVCGKLCVPAEADLALPLLGKRRRRYCSGGGRSARPASRGALSGKRSGGTLAVRSVHRELGEGQQRVVVEVTAPQDAPVELFVEGPTPDWALPLPEAEKSAAGVPISVRRFIFALDGLPSARASQRRDADADRSFAHRCDRG